MTIFLRKMRAHAVIEGRDPGPWSNDDDYAVVEGKLIGRIYASGYREAKRSGDGSCSRDWWCRSPTAARPTRSRRRRPRSPSGIGASKASRARSARLRTARCPFGSLISAAASSRACLVRAFLRPHRAQPGAADRGRMHAARAAGA
jgi:hypothetical protein